MTRYADPKVNEPPIGSDTHPDEGFKASVTKSFRVWADADKARVGYRQTPWFPKAFEWLSDGMQAGRRPSLQVAFRWRTRNKEGDGSVSYTPEHHLSMGHRYVEGEINKLIANEIAEAIASGRFVRVSPERRK